MMLSPNSVVTGYRRKVRAKLPQITERLILSHICGSSWEASSGTASTQIGNLEPCFPDQGVDRPIKMATAGEFRSPLGSRISTIMRTTLRGV
jgi:hypothetical protein